MDEYTRLAFQAADQFLQVANMAIDAGMPVGAIRAMLQYYLDIISDLRYRYGLDNGEFQCMCAPAA